MSSFARLLEPVRKIPIRSAKAVLAGLFLITSAGAQPTFVPILTNGPASNRLNIVLLSEGYTSNELSKFLVDVTNTVNALLTTAPFSEYRSYVNAFAIQVASAETGSDHPTTPEFRDTYFNSTYDPDSDLLITIPPDFTDTNYDHGQGKVDSLLRTFLPNTHLTILLVNDPVFGGSDGSGKTAIAATASGSSVFVVHESGHVLANLGDEYTRENPGYPDTEEPNTTQQTNFESIKWSVWINTNTTPIPTPAIGAYSSTVGLFEGAHYHASGWYRPQLNCAMGSFNSPFCAVCGEALVLALYQHVRPIERFSPVVTNISMAGTQSLAFDVVVLQPKSHNLVVQWFTNSTPIPGATNSHFDLAPAAFSGTNRVCVSVSDPTVLVRNDPSHLLSQTIAWTVSDAPRLSLDSPSWVPEGFSLRVEGQAPSVIIEESSDLQNWISLTTNSLDGEFFYTRSNLIGVDQRYFRARTPL